LSEKGTTILYNFFFLRTRTSLISLYLELFKLSKF
ncbi:unnamed protein product, partial [Larinioides sclopetarius]